MEHAEVGDVLAIRPGEIEEGPGTDIEEGADEDSGDEVAPSCFSRTFLLFVAVIHFLCFL